MKCQLLVPAAGSGRRLGYATPKALVPLAGRPLLAHTLDRFRELELLDHAVLVIPPDHRAAVYQVLDTYFPGFSFRLVPGGAERQDSVSRGLVQLGPETSIVVIHDAARPFVSQASVRASIAAAKEWGAATVAVPVADTILEADDDEFLDATPDRSRLWACQTPQTFQSGVIREAHEQAQTRNEEATDDATLVRRAGGRVKLVRGSSLNFKITSAADLVMAQRIIEEGIACFESE